VGSAADVTTLSSLDTIVLKIRIGTTVYLLYSQSIKDMIKCK